MSCLIRLIRLNIFGFLGIRFSGSKQELGTPPDDATDHELIRTEAAFLIDYYSSESFLFVISCIAKDKGIFLGHWIDHWSNLTSSIDSDEHRNHAQSTTAWKYKIKWMCQNRKRLNGKRLSLVSSLLRSSLVLKRLWDRMKSLDKLCISVRRHCFIVWKSNRSVAYLYGTLWLSIDLLFEPSCIICMVHTSSPFCYQEDYNTETSIVWKLGYIIWFPESFLSKLALGVAYWRRCQTF